MFSQTRNELVAAYESYRGIPEHHQPTACHLQGIVFMFNTGWMSGLVHLLTVHDHRHALDEVVNNLERLSRGCPSLIFRKPIQPL